MMKAMMGFTKGVLLIPMPWPLWIGLLVFANLIAPLFFFDTPEAQVTVATFLASGVLMMGIYGARGFVRLLGVGHIFWVALVPWLVTRLGQSGSSDLFEYWMLSVIILNSLSLILDTLDVYRYLNGDREPYVTVS